jgi:hypothetical protein
MEHIRRILKLYKIHFNKIRRLELAGHLVRMSDDMTVKKAFLGKSDGRGKAERPTLRWLDFIENDLKSVDVKRRKSEDICVGYHSEVGTG